MKFNTKTLLCIFAVLFISQVNAFGDDQKEDLQEFYDGLFEQANLDDPTTLINCYDASSANLTLIFLGNLFTDLANNNGIKAVVDFQKYNTNLPDTVTNCLKHNQEFQSMAKAYNLQGKSFLVIGNAIIKYVASNYKAVRETLLTLDADYHEGQYQQSGKITGELLQKAIPSQENQDFDWDILHNF